MSEEDQKGSPIPCSPFHPRPFCSACIAKYEREEKEKREQKIAESIKEWDERQRIMIRFRGILPTYVELVRELERDITGQTTPGGLLRYSRGGWHLYGLDQKPVDFIPSDHIMFALSASSAPILEERVPGDDFTIGARLPSVPTTLRCPLCGLAVRVGLSLAVGESDLVMIGCPNLVKERVVVAEYKTSGIL